MKLTRANYFYFKVTHKPSSDIIGEKFDRRHFGPQKLEITEQPSNASILQATVIMPDLPMSPSRDVLHHRRKTNNEVSVEVLKNKDFKNVSGEDKFNTSFNDSFETSFSEDINFMNSEVSTTVTTVTTTRKMSWLPSYDNDNEKQDYVTGNWNKSAGREKVNVTILGLFELTQKKERRPEGLSELQAAKLAIDRINKMELLPKFHLRLHHNDTEVKINLL